MKKKSLLNLILAGSIILVLYGISSCAEHKFAAEDCLTMTRDEAVDAWMQSGKLEPIDSILVYTSLIGSGSPDDLEVRVYGETESGTVISGTGIDLRKSPDCKAGVGPDVNFVRNQIALADLNIKDGTGLKDFSYINFVPGAREYEGRKYLAYQVSVLMDGKWSVPIWTDPCPPLCPIPPNPTDTLPPTDTLR